MRDPLSQSNSTRPLIDLSHVYLSVIVPVFNERENIIDNLDLLTSEVEQYFDRFEIIVVSDGSTDGTNLKLFSFRYPNLRLVIEKDNKGKGHAVRAGFAKAQGDYILFIDGGLELHPKEVYIFSGLMALYDADIVVGSKRHPQSQVDYPRMRQFLSWVYQCLVRAMFDVDVTDTQVGIKLFKKDVVKAILPDLNIDRYGFDLEILTLARLQGYSKVLEAPIRMDYFNKNRRNVVMEGHHILKVGFSLLKDTIRLYRKMRRVRRHKTNLCLVDPPSEEK